MRVVQFIIVFVLVLVWLRRMFPPRRPRAVDGPPWDPWAILGIPRGASPDAVTRAYHDRLKEYHPDRVAGLGNELQNLAHQKTLDIQRAYAELTRQA